MYPCRGTQSGRAVPLRVVEALGEGRTVSLRVESGQPSLSGEPLAGPKVTFSRAMGLNSILWTVMCQGGRESRRTRQVEGKSACAASVGEGVDFMP